eukprot:1175490-Prorocentrum_minimum.AAC.1
MRRIEGYSTVKHWRLQYCEPLEATYFATLEATVLCNTGGYSTVKHWRLQWQFSNATTAFNSTLRLATKLINADDGASSTTTVDLSSWGAKSVAPGEVANTTFFIPFDTYLSKDDVARRLELTIDSTDAVTETNNVGNTYLLEFQICFPADLEVGATSFVKAGELNLDVVWGGSVCLTPDHMTEHVGSNTFFNLTYETKNTGHRPAVGNSSIGWTDKVLLDGKVVGTAAETGPLAANGTVTKTVTIDLGAPDGATHKLQVLHI